MPPEETTASETPPPEVTPSESTPDEPQALPSSVGTTGDTQEPARTAQMGGNEPFVPAPEPMTPPTSIPVMTSVLRSMYELAARARAVIQNRKTKKLEKIMHALNMNGKITNDQVEKLLHVSDATATRYLSALEKQGKVKQVGKTGKAVRYEKI